MHRVCDSKFTFRAWVQAPCGVRGIVAGQAGVSLADLDRGPLISLPYALYFDAKNAQALVAVALAAASRNGALAHEDAMHTVLSSLSAVQTLGLALALERQRGVASAWHTYICSLPPQPPCPWLLPEQVKLQRVGSACGGRIFFGRCRWLADWCIFAVYD